MRRRPCKGCSSCNLVTVKTGILAPAALALVCAACSAERIPLSTSGPDRAPLVMAFMSERPPSPPYGADIYLYDLREGGPAYLAPNLNTVDLEGPCALSADGRKLAFYTNRSTTGSLAQLLLYDVAHATTVVPEKINQLQTLQNPSLSDDGRFLAVQYQVGGPFELYIAVEDLASDSLLPVPNLNVPNATTFDPSLSGDGSLIAFASNRFGSLGSWDIFLYSVPGDSLIGLPGMNSPAGDLAPSISRDGRYIAFQSGRPGVVAPNDSLIDVYVYDRVAGRLLPLPGANTQLAEILPTISPDGRYLAYVTEQTGARDVRVYDIRERRLLRLEGLNDPYYRDYFPTLASP
jgi:Tol biopolymer transport system component